MVDDEESIYENVFSTAFKNEEFEYFGKGIMTCSDHDIILKLDNTELQLWPKWVENIPPQTKVGIVTNYRGWQVRNRPGGPVWREFREDSRETRFVTPHGLQLNDEEKIGKYGQTVKVITVQKDWAHQLYSLNPTTEQEETKI